MGKFKMPNEQKFLKRKRIFGPRRSQVWVYLMREMKENEKRKPLNTRVANWLLFLKDLRYHYYCEVLKQYNRLCTSCGPPWFMEFSKEQKEVLANIKKYMYMDLLEDLPSRVKRALWDLGLTLRLPNESLLTAISDACGDPGIFLWKLYEMIYKVPPSHLLPIYDLNSMLLMSCLTYIDMEECIQLLNKLCSRNKQPPPPKKIPRPPKEKLHVKFGEYLQAPYRIRLYSNYPDEIPRHKKPQPLAFKIKLKSKESHEKLILQTEFIQLRRERNIRAALVERKCKYKFWEPPVLLGNTDPKVAIKILLMKMMKKKPKKLHLKHRPPYENIECMISGVSYSCGRPVYILANYTAIPTGYMAINGGLVRHKNEYLTIVLGMWFLQDHSKKKCDVECDCLATGKYAARVKHLKASRCSCERYDFNDMEHKEKSDILFYPPTRTLPFLFDQAKIYQLDSYVEFIRDTVKTALASKSSVSSREEDFTTAGLPNHKILEIFLGELANTPLIIPHLPQANRLKSLTQWVSRLIRGPETPTKHKKLMIGTQRGWIHLNHIDFTAKAYRIPFTRKELYNMNWSHRTMLQRMANTLLQDFELRTRTVMMEHTRLFWSTMRNEIYPSKAFSNAFFTYMPARLVDTLVFAPHCKDHTPTHGAKTCPLSR